MELIDPNEMTISANIYRDQQYFIIINPSKYRRETIKRVVLNQT